MKPTGEKRGTRLEACPSATLSTTNPTWTEPGSNPGLRRGRSAANRLSHGRANGLIVGIVSSNLTEDVDGSRFCLLCCLLSGLCNELITLSGESYRLSASVSSRYLNNEAACTQYGLLGHRGEKVA
jgi:hypothetical protein